MPVRAAPQSPVRAAPQPPAPHRERSAAGDGGHPVREPRWWGMAWAASGRAANEIVAAARPWESRREREVMAKMARERSIGSRGGIRQRLLRLTVLGTAQHAAWIAAALTMAAPQRLWRFRSQS